METNKQKATLQHFFPHCVFPSVPVDHDREKSVEEVCEPATSIFFSLTMAKPTPKHS
jgi:hypothetical protein